MHLVRERQHNLKQAIVSTSGVSPTGIIQTPSRAFSNKNKENAPPEKKEGAAKVTVDEAFEEPKAEAADETKGHSKHESKQEENDPELEALMNTATFKTYRKFLFTMGKLLKYTCWFMGSLFLYHVYLVMKKDKPEEGFLANDRMLIWAYETKGFYQFIRDLLTKPPVNSLLMERPPTPPGYQPMKTLVLNVSGTLTHSEYKLGVGFEIMKRPGLSVFLS